ncbi:carbohydrate-binding module family 18 protein, partial [Macroventuria anomochaeta]
MNPFLLVVCPAVAILSGLVSAANNIKFVNHCPYDVYSWTVGPVKSGYTGNDHEAVTIPANSVTIQGMVNGEAIGGGIFLKLRDLPEYQVAPTGNIQVEYNIEPSQNHVSYDLSAIDCDHSVGPENPSFCPLIGSGMKIHVEHANKGRCPPASCGADGVCHHTYKEHGFWEDEHNFRCDAGTDIVVEFCTEKAGPRTFNGHMEPGHPAEPQPDTKPGQQTTNGVCGKETPDEATCFGYAHGNCCSEYGWCGYSEAHCGTGCQSDFGDC